MSLFGTIQQSRGALQAAQIGLQVVGNNVANANTPGYLRQKLEQSSSIAVREGGLIKGHGVRPTGIVQTVDKALVERMFNAKTELSGAESLEKAYSQLEELTSDLDNTGLSNQLSQFNNAIHELSSQPGDHSLREFVVLQGQTLAGSIRDSREKAIDRREQWNSELDVMSTQINRLLDRIAGLNIDIATIEGGGLIHSDATGLRDQRYQDLEELATYFDINIQEQESGSISVFVGGDYLINNGIYREVYTAISDEDGGNEIRIMETDSPVQAKTGRLASTLAARDQVFNNYIEDLNVVAASLIRGVNEVHSQGQGRAGFLEIESSVRANTGVPLLDAGLAWDPRNGSFDMSLVDEQGQVLSHHRINVQILGQVTDSTVASIAADIDNIDGVSSFVNSEGRLVIEADAPTATFTFGEDTSGFLAAAGLNTFFTGDGALDIEVNQTLVDDAGFLAISSGGIAEDTDVLTKLVDLVDRPQDNLNGRSIRRGYGDMVTAIGQNISLQSSATEGLRNFHANLQGQHLAITGVNIDEESILMISYQRAFQASSRVISTASEMLELLVTL